MRSPARFVVLCTLAACVTRATPTPDPPPSSWSELSLSRRDQIDILFLVDNSPSMAPKQKELSDTFPLLVDAMRRASQGRAAAYHIGVVTSDLGAGPFTLGQGQCHPGGDGGRLQGVGRHAPADCAGPMGSNFVVLDERTGSSNLPPTQSLGQTFNCMAQVGDRGCGFEQPLEAVYRALHDPVPGNEGFLRPEALLVVVFVTDEDDCSAPSDTDLFDPVKAEYGPLLSFRCTRYGLLCGEDGQPPPQGSSGGPLSACRPAPAGKLHGVQRYIDFFAKPAAQGGIKLDPSDVLLLSVAGPEVPVETVLANPNPQPPGPHPSCFGPADGKTCTPELQHSCVRGDAPSFYADPAVRLFSVVTSAVNHAQSSLCDPFGATMARFGTAIGSADALRGCLTAPLFDPEVPECVVEDLELAGDPIRIPACVDGVGPCWRIVEDLSCPEVLDPRSGLTRALRLLVDRFGERTPVATHGRCLTSPAS